MIGLFASFEANKRNHEVVFPMIFGPFFHVLRILGLAF